MALSRTNVHGSISADAIGGNFTTTSFTPPDSSLLVVAVGVMATGDAIDGAAITCSGGSLTYTQRVESDTTASSYDVGVAIFTAPVTTGASMTITAGGGAISEQFVAVSAVAYTGYDTGTPTGATGSGFDTDTPDGAQSLTLSGAPATSSEVFAGMVMDKEGVGTTPGAAFTEIHDLQVGSTGGLETEIRTGSTSTTVDWVDSHTGTGSIFKAAFAALEIKAAAAAASVSYVQRPAPLQRDPSESYYIQKDRRDANLLSTALLENELLGGATNFERFVAATHASRRLIPQQPDRESAPGLLDSALLENELLGGATTELRTFAPATHVDRREVPQFTLRESPAGLLDSAQLEVPPPLPWWYDEAAYLRVPWLRVKQPQADQSSAALIDFDPTQAGYDLSTTAFVRQPWLRQKPVLADQSVAPAPLVRTDLLSQSFNSPGTGSATTSAFAPPSNSLLVVALEGANIAAGNVTGAMTITDSVGLTWTQQVTVATDEGSADTYTTGVSIFTAPVTTGVSMTLTFDAGALDIDHFACSVVAYTGYDTVTPIGATGTNFDQDGSYGAPATASLTLSASPAASSEVFAAAAANVFGASGGVTPGSGWTEIYELGPINNWGELQSQYRRSSVSTSVNWDDLNSTNTGIFGWATGAIEVRAGSDAPVADIPWASITGLATVTHQRSRWLRLKPVQVDQSSQPSSTPFDPTQAGYGWIARLAPATHVDRREYPAQRSGIQNPDDVSIVGSGATMAWWGVDDTAVYFNHWLPTQSDPSFYIPAVEADPLILQDSSDRERMWFVRPWFGLQRTAIANQGSAPPPDADPTQAGYGPRWLWYRAPVAPVQRDRESDPRLLLTALLENELLGGYDDILRHRTWHIDRRLVPQQRSYPDALQPPADPLLVGGAEWRYRLIPVTHKARWVLRQWWQQQMFQGADPVLFEGTVVGGTFGGPGSTGGNLGGYVIGGSQ